VSPRSFADSQRPFVWMRSRISPSWFAGPQAFRSSSIGMCPYGIWWSWTIRSAPTTPAKPTSITFEVSMFRPTRKPIRKTVAPTSIQVGQTGRVGLPRPRNPIQAVRAIA